MTTNDTIGVFDRLIAENYQKLAYYKKLSATSEQYQKILYLRQLELYITIHELERIKQELSRIALLSK